MGFDEAVNRLGYRDAWAGQPRFAAFEKDRLAGALFIARDPVTVSRSRVRRHELRFLPPRDFEDYPRTANFRGGVTLGVKLLPLPCLEDSQVIPDPKAAI